MSLEQVDRKLCKKVDFNRVLQDSGKQNEDSSAKGIETTLQIISLVLFLVGIHVHLSSNVHWLMVDVVDFNLALVHYLIQVGGGVFTNEVSVVSTTFVSVKPSGKTIQRVVDVVERLSVTMVLTVFNQSENFFAEV